MGTIVDLGTYAYAVKWMRTNVGETIRHDKNFVQGHGWTIDYSCVHTENSNTPYQPIFVINIDDQEKAVEFALIFGNS